MTTLDEAQSNYKFFMILDLNEVPEQYSLHTDWSNFKTEVERSDYSIIDVSGNIYLALKSKPKNYSSTLFIGDEKININNQYYYNASELIDVPVNNDSYLFSITASKPIGPTLGSQRCDVDMNGPSVFLRLDEEVDSYFNSNVVSTMGDLKMFRPIISVDGVAHLICVELTSKEKDNFDLNMNNMPKSARTISENLKQIIEWSMLADEPWNSNEEISIACKKFLKDIAMPESVRLDLINNQADMQVSRFFSGDTNARMRPPVEEISEMSGILRSWLNRLFFYTSIEELNSKIGIA